MTADDKAPEPHPLPPRGGEVMSDVRQCGSCHACCVLPYLRGLHKARNTPCKHLKPSAQGCCGIYADRPPTCRLFNCAWKLRPDLFDDNWYPLTAHILVMPTLGYTVLCDPQSPDVWRTEPYYSRLLQLVKDGEPVCVRIGTKGLWLNEDGTLSKE
jgi:hypothetical protein